MAGPRPGSVALERFASERFLGFERHIGPQMFDDLRDERIIQQDRTEYRSLAFFAARQ